MSMERETAREVVISIAAVIFFVAVVVTIGATFMSDGGLTSQGGIVLVGAIGAFVLVMTAVGYFLSRY